jgi:hypothetical protein
MTNLLLAVLVLCAQEKAPLERLWPKGAPGAVGEEERDKPSITPFFAAADKATGAACIVCPGGGFRFLSWQSEGTEVAEWLRDHGVAAFVLKYRVLDTGATEAEFQKSVAELFRSINERTSGKEPAANPVESIERMQIVSLAAADGRQAMKVVRRCFFTARSSESRRRCTWPITWPVRASRAANNDVVPWRL